MSFDLNIYAVAADGLFFGIFREPPADEYNPLGRLIGWRFFVDQINPDGTRNAVWDSWEEGILDALEHVKSYTSEELIWLNASDQSIVDMGKVLLTVSGC